MTKTHYTATFSDGTQIKRSSSRDCYSHAWRAGTYSGFCGTRANANKAGMTVHKQIAAGQPFEVVLVVKVDASAHRAADAAKPFRVYRVYKSDGRSHVMTGLGNTALRFATHAEAHAFAVAKPVYDDCYHEVRGPKKKLTKQQIAALEAIQVNSRANVHGGVKTRLQSAGLITWDFATNVCELTFAGLNALNAA